MITFESGLSASLTGKGISLLPIITGKQHYEL